MSDAQASLSPAPLSVAIAGDAIASGEVALDALQAPIADSPLLALANNSPYTADIRVVAQPNSVFRFYTGDRSTALAAFRIPVKKARSLPLKVNAILEQIAAFQNLARLQAPPSYIADVIDLQFVQLLEPATRGSTKEPAASALSRNDAGNYQLTAGSNLAITFSHRAPDPLYLYVVAMDSRLQSVGLVYPYRTEFSARVKPNEGTLLVGAGPEYLIEMQVPQGYPDGLDTFKVFVSASAIEPDVLAMPNLGSRSTVSNDPYGSGARLDRDLRRVMLGIEGTSEMPNFTNDPWWTMSEAIQVIKAA